MVYQSPAPLFLPKGHYWLMADDPMYPLVNIQIAIENGPLRVDLPIKVVIFHSHVSLPEGYVGGMLVLHCFFMFVK